MADARPQSRHGRRSRQKARPRLTEDAAVATIERPPITEEGRALNDADAANPPSHHPLAALRQRDFRLFALTRLLSGAATTMLQAAIAWQVFNLAEDAGFNSALALGLLGGARFLPALGLSLVGGAVADSYDRRKVLLLSQIVPLGCSATLALATHTGSASLPMIYGIALALAVAASFENPSRQALLPQLVQRETFANAVAVNSTVQQLAFVAGPAVGGALIAAWGVGGAYLVHIALIAGAMTALVLIRPRPPTGERRQVSVAAIAEGIRFVRHRQALLGAMALDMFAVIFAGATALLPIYAKEILHVGARGYGLLSSAQAVGAFAMALVLVALPPVQRTGRALLLAAAAFGIATVIFGLSHIYALSLFAYALTGVADQLSVVMRLTTIQLATPDELRGRVSAVSGIFVGASNQIGMMESGIVSALTNATIAVVSGGAACIAVVAAVAAGMPELRRYRITPAAPRPIAAPPATVPEAVTAPVSPAVAQAEPLEAGATPARPH